MGLVVGSLRPSKGRRSNLYFSGTVLHLGVRNISHASTGQVGLGVGSWPSNRTTEGSNPKGTRLYFVILLKNVEKVFDWH